MTTCGLYNRHLRDKLTSTVFRGGVALIVSVMIMSSIFYFNPEMAMPDEVFIYTIAFSALVLLIIRYSCYLLIESNKFRKYEISAILIFSSSHFFNKLLYFQIYK